MNKVFETTIATFASLTKKSIALQYTNASSYICGTTIYLHIDAEYSELEHLLAHIVFGTEYEKECAFAQTIANILKLPVEAKEFIISIIDALEDHRINTLWERIYKGSAIDQKQKRHHKVKKSSPNHLDHCIRKISDNIAIPDSSPFYDHLEIIKKALDMSIGSFNATLLSSKWLFSQLTVHPTLSKKEMLLQLASYGFSPSKDVLFDSESIPNKKEVNELLNTPVTSSTFENLLTQEKESIEEVITSLQVTPPPEHITQDICRACVIFNDLTKSDTIINLNSEDNKIITSLQAKFRRIAGRKASMLENSGLDIDIPSVIQNSISHTSLACFKTPLAKRGFKALILLDKSSSMEELMPSAARTCFILNEALKSPHTEIDVWGFNSPINGKVRIDRYSQESLGELPSATEGNTPTHVALDIALRYLEKSNCYKHIFLITDGKPTYVDATETEITYSDLKAALRKSFLKARQKKVGISTLLLNSSIPIPDRNYMFLNTWKQVSVFKFSTSLTKAVESCFGKYLQE